MPASRLRDTSGAEAGQHERAGARRGRRGRSANCWMSDFSAAAASIDGHDAADRGVEADAIDAHVDLAVLHHGGGEDGVPGRALDRQRLARHRLLVDERLAAHDRAVDGRRCGPADDR